MAAVRGDGVPDLALLKALETAPDAVVFFTADGVVVFANAATEPVFGWTPEELLGSNIGELLHKDDLAAAIASVAAFDDQGLRSRSPATMRFRWPDGHYAVLQVNGNPLEIEGQATVYTMFARRAEDQRLMMDALQRLADTADLDELLLPLPELLQWRLDTPHLTIVWKDGDGDIHLSGDEIAPLLIGAEEADEASPWTRAWNGEDQRGKVEDLPPFLRDLALEQGLRDYRVHPIRIDDGPVRVLLTLWADDRTHPMRVFEPRLLELSKLTEISIRFADQQQQLLHQADHDALTGLVNRRRFYEEVQQCRSADQRVAVLYVDLDDFKPVNDKWGHRVGDFVLAEVATRLRASCREDDVVARLGGDEFGVLCRTCTEAEAKAVADRFLASLREPFDLGGDLGDERAEVSASIGLASGWEIDAEALALHADEALYRAKRTGGRGVTVAGRP